MRKIKWILAFIVIASMVISAAFLISSISLAEMYNIEVSGGDDMNDGFSKLTPIKTGKQAKKIDKFTSNGSKFRVKQNYPSSLKEVGLAFSNSLNDDELDRIILGSEIVTGWTAFSTTTWKANLEKFPEAIKSNDEWLVNGCYKDFLKDGEWFWEENTLFINNAEGNPDITGKIITALFYDQEPLIITGWTHSPPAVWQSIFETQPEHVMVNDTWYLDWWWGPLECDYTETGELNTLYLRDADGNPDVIGKRIAAVTKNGGWSVTSGDFNGDGLSDVVHSNHGSEVYVHYGNNEFPSMPNQVLIDPEGNRFLGFYVASAGDVNNDGFDELLVAMNWGNDKVYLYMGSHDGLNDTPDITLTTPSGYSGFGHAISLREGDLNGDGFDDILIGGESYFCVYYGDTSGINVTPDEFVSYTDTGSYTNLSSVGDINNDGYDDIAVSPSKLLAGYINVYVYYGSADGIDIKNPQIIIISIPAIDVYINGAVAPAGDVNKDGFADLLIGSQYSSGSYEMEGKAYIFYGSASGLSGSADVIIDNPNPEYNVRFGNSVDGIRDFNHDGFDDIVVGCPYGSYASIYFGSPEGVSSGPSLILSGINWLGWSVSQVGDIKGNGQNFIVVGEEFGAAYLYALTADLADPKPDIKANGSDGPVTITPSDTLSVTIELDDAGITDNADWWVLGDTPFGWYYYNHTWGWLPGLLVTYQGPLFDLSSFEVLDMTLPEGSYTLYFGVDMVMNGSVDMGQMYYDRVDVIVK